MKIVSVKPEYTQAFDGIVLEPLRFFDFDMSLFNDLTIYLGYNPNPNVLRPHYSPSKKHIVILVYDSLPIENNMSLMALGAHEIGHHLHFKLLGDDKVKWQDWATKTSRKLSFEVTDNSKGTTQIKSYEDFAWDFHKIINYNLDPFYLDLFGINLVEMEIDNKEYKVNSQLKIADVAPYIHNNRTMAPMRVVAEALDIKVHYLLRDGKQLVKFAKRGASNG